MGQQVGDSVFGGMVGQQTRLHHLQAIVSGKVHHKVPCHDFFVAQIGVHDDTFVAVECVGHTPRRIAQMATGHSPTRSELAHDSGQTLGPITGPERLSVLGDPKDKNFFGGVRNHRVEAENRFLVTGDLPVSPGLQLFYLI